MDMIDEWDEMERRRRVSMVFEAEAISKNLSKSTPFQNCQFFYLPTGDSTKSPTYLYEEDEKEKVVEY
jgi:hypothetical protein